MSESTVVREDDSFVDAHGVRIHYYRWRAAQPKAVVQLVHGLGEYAARWADLPAGADPLENPLGGAPGFVLENVYVLPGLPAEMEAMFESIEDRFRGEPIATWRCAYDTGEARIVDLLEEATRAHTAVSVGSYPRFGAKGPTVEVVLKSTDATALDAAQAWLAAELDGRANRLS